MAGPDCHGGGGEATATIATGAPRVVLVGSPNAGKTSIFNALTGLRAKTGNYPGVTVARFQGTCRVGGTEFVIEDLPGTYSLEPISPDERVVVDVIDGRLDDGTRPDAVLAIVDATTLRRSLGFLAEVLGRGLPACVVVTFTDELVRRQGRLDTGALARSLGVPVVTVIGNRGSGIARLRGRLPDWREWPVPVIAAPTDPAERDAWAESVLASAGYRSPERHRLTQRIDAVLLHPVWGTLIFLVVMVGFFQTIFSVAAPMQDGLERFFGWLSGLVEAHIPYGWLSGLLGQAIIGGVGGVLVFLPQILSLFLLIALMEGVGYMSRAAFLMDRLMGRAGLEGRAFVALLSSTACAIPGIMATRTLPSAKDRLATMMATPLMTCSARLPVYLLLIGLLVDPKAKVGPLGAQGVVMFGMYLLGAVSALTVAWAFKKLADRHSTALPFYMEMPPYRVPSARTVLAAIWYPAGAFLRKAATIIVMVSIGLWLLLNLPVPSTAAMQAAGVDPADSTAVAAYTIDHSVAAGLGRAVAPVFEPLGFDWRVNVGVLSAQSARETFVATLGQVAAAEDPENPGQALRAMTHTDGPHAGELVFTPPTIAALLVFFAYALQCIATLAMLKRETGTWKWPAIAFGYLAVLAWTMAYLARTVTAMFAG